MNQGFYENVYRLKDGAIILYTRPGRTKPVWQARLKVPGVTGYVIKSLKTTDLNGAISAAEDLFHDLKAEQRLGLDVKVSGNLRFKDFWKRFYDVHQSGLSVHRQRLHRGFANKYFIPYFGEQRVSDMPDAFVEQYWDWRINFHNPENWEDEEDIPANAARVPAQKTLDMEAGMLRQIFRWGKRVGFVKREPWIKATKVKHTKGVERRPTFTEDEWKTVYQHMRGWVKEGMVSTEAKGGGRLHRKGPHTLHRFQRELLRNYLLFMANSGLRPNEARQLRWQDLRVEKDIDGKAVLVVEVSPTTKTGARTVVCRDGSQVYVERLRKLPNILRLYTDERYRDSVASAVRNEVVRNFWLHEFKNYPPRLRAEACAPIQNKLGALLSDPTLYRILVEPKADVRFRSLMDEGKALLVNVSKGRLGEDSSFVLGGLVLSTLALGALSRADTAERRPFHIYVDEFQSFTTLMLANMLPELRKYGVGLTLANQHLAQIEPEIRSAVLGNAGTLISFRVGAEDAPYLAREFQPTFDVGDLLQLPNRSIYVKLMIDGTPSKPFSAMTLSHDDLKAQQTAPQEPPLPAHDRQTSNFL